MDKGTIWSLVLIVLVIMAALIYETNKDDREVKTSYFEIVENFTKDVVKVIVDDSTFNANVEVTYINKIENKYIFTASVDSLPNDLKSIQLRMALTDDNKELYIIGK